MKYLRIAIVFAFMFSFFTSYGQKITIDDFNNKTIDKFENGQTITDKAVKKGFKIEIQNVSEIEGIKQKNAAGVFLKVNESVTDGITNGKSYDIKNPKVENDTLLIMLIKGDEKKELKILVDATSADIPSVAVPSTILNEPQANCPSIKGYDNKFGEEAKYYDNDKIVYVYDFNKDPSKREFYKITRKSKKELKELSHAFNKQGPDGLNQRLVNFNKEKLTRGKNVKFKIHNINKFMYNVSIADSVIQFDSEPSELFTRLFLGDSTLLGSLLGAFSDDVSAQSIGFDDLNKKIRAFVEKYNLLQNKILAAYDPCSSFPCCYSLEYTQLANDLTVIRADAVKLQLQLNNKKKTVAENKKKLDACEKNQKEIKENSETIKKNEEELKAIKQKLPSLTGDEKKNKQEELDAKEKELKKLQATKSKLEKVRADKCTDLKKTDYKKKMEKAQGELLELNTINTLLSNLPSDRDLKKVIVFLRNMVETNNSHTSDFISLNGNVLDLTISISSKDSIFNYFSIPEYKNDPLRIQIPILGKPLASFSSGSFIAVGNNLQNKTFAWQEIIGNNNTADSSGFTLVESGLSTPVMGFSALGNIQWKINRSFGIGGSAGVGLTIEETPRLAYLAGVSLFLGDSRQFVITSGFAGMQVDRLTNDFQTISDNQVIFNTQPDIEFFEEFKVGAFVSVTYTPFRLYKTRGSNK